MFYGAICQLFKINRQPDFGIILNNQGILYSHKPLTNGMILYFCPYFNKL
jgi:hypothetical protein